MTICVAGIGYGGDVTSEVAAALADADVVIGHEEFLAAIRHLVSATADCFDVQDIASPGEDIFALRARVAALRERDGARVVIVSGGDPGLLGMAGPFLSHLHGAAGPSIPAAPARILPGLSAWQYAAARLGAPFNGGLCVLSLCLYSHTEDTVRRQVAGAAASGLGIAAYMLRHNGEMKPERYPTAEPAAALARRRFLMLRDELLGHRPPGTPTFLVANLGMGQNEWHERAALADSLRLWERSDERSVFCVPGLDHAEAAGLTWSRT